VRAIEPVEGIETMRALRQSKGNPRKERDLTSGPARLTQALAIGRTLNGTDLVTGDELWLEPGDFFPDGAVERGPRVGIRYAAEKDQRVPWRFWVRDNSYVSR
jgi:DNA-3-methyladenine glycosylase